MKRLVSGLAEILASLLSQIDRFQKSISVIPTSEVRRQRVDGIAEANRTFNANLVMTGSLQKTPEGIRVVLNLVDSRNAPPDRFPDRLASGRGFPNCRAAVC